MYILFHGKKNNNSIIITPYERKGLCVEPGKRQDLGVRRCEALYIYKAYTLSYNSLAVPPASAVMLPDNLDVFIVR